MPPIFILVYCFDFYRANLCKHSSLSSLSVATHPLALMLISDFRKRITPEKKLEWNSNDPMTLENIKTLSLIPKQKDVLKRAIVFSIWAHTSILSLCKNRLTFDHSTKRGKFKFFDISWAWTKVLFLIEETRSVIVFNP